MVPSRCRTDIDAVAAAVSRAAAHWTADTRVCVALSGGVDSVVLLHAVALAHRAAAASWRLAAHHVHHGLSPNADTWAQHCEALCATLGVAFTVDRVTIDRASPVGIEAAARETRYRALDRVDATVVLLAHHARDQAETLLLQLLRGAGPAGLAAMPQHNARYLRPLLRVSKAEVLAYARLHSLTWIEDESNEDTRFARNRLRRDVWPPLVASFPSAETTLSRAAAHQADAAQLLDDLAVLDAAACVDGGALKLPPFNALSRARRANLLRHWLAGRRVATPATHTLHEWLQQLACDRAEQAIELRLAASVAPDVSVRAYRGLAYVVREHAPWQPCDWSGESELNLASDQTGFATVTFSRSIMPGALRTPRAGERWRLRRREDGDRVALSGNSGHVSLKNIFQNANIPPWQRSLWPLLTCDNEIACVVGIATATAFTVPASETGVLCEWKPAWDGLSAS
jgi:tRNA(Ile)-lysidine synthase